MGEYASCTGGTVFLFSGQGSQKPGMGLDLLDIASVAETFICASDVFGFDVAKRIQQASPEELNETRNAQAALATLSIALAHAVVEAGIKPSSLIGFSLGQISALPTAGFLSREDTFRFVKIRAAAMARAAEENPGAMCVLLGSDEETAQQACNECAQGDVLVLANYNCPGQIVASGAKEAINRLEEYWKTQKKRVLRMATSGAFHSPLMEPAAQELSAYLENVSFGQPSIPLVSNLDASVLTQDTIKDHLVRHVTHPVRFEQSVRKVREAGATAFIELGFGGVLTGLVKRIDKESARFTVQDVASFEEVQELYGK